VLTKLVSDARTELSHVQEENEHRWYRTTDRGRKAKTRGGGDERSLPKDDSELRDGVGRGDKEDRHATGTLQQRRVGRVVKVRTRIADNERDKTRGERTEYLRKRKECAEERTKCLEEENASLQKQLRLVSLQSQFVQDLTVKNQALSARTENAETSALDAVRALKESEVRVAELSSDLARSRQV